TAGVIQQIFTGLAKFRLQGAEAQAFYLWSKAFGEEWNWNLKLRWLANYRTVLRAIQPLLVTLIFYLVVTSDMQEAVKEGKDPFVQLSYAQFVAFLTAFTGLNTTLNESIGLVINLLTLQPHVDNIQTILSEVPEGTDDRMDAGALSGRIEIEHLRFAYDQGGADVIQDLNLQVKAGEHLAIVGKSGCGKSTLIRLLLGFEKPKSGAIYYDGHDLMDLNLSSVRTQMGVVLQNGQLMTGDIFTNIVGTAALSMDDAWAAAEAAGIADDIRAMPMGMHTVLSEGSSNISVGQRQRIMIARALAGHPAVILFDEATSALDNRTQAIVTKSLQKMKCTRLVVAHRLSTIREADRIVVLDQGRIVETGTFAELAAKDGIFAQLVQRQMA
uniref:ATP-binding cassette domain-containing protein n=1 Tax=Selenomonas sp. TaxID=2053611 RepID=UPI0025EB3FE9